MFFLEKVWVDIRAREMTPEDKKVSRDIEERYNKLGRMSYMEIVVLIHFIALATLWFLRNPKFISGHSFFNYFEQSLKGAFH